jgi:hypothetical protein
MPELERALRTVGRNLELPATPDLSAPVRLRLAEAERPRDPFSRRRALVVALAVLAVAAGAVLSVPQARSTIRDWLGIGGVTIRYVEELPPAERATSDLGLGERVSLGEARVRAGLRVLLPSIEGLSRPPRVYHRPEARQVAFLYGSEDDPKLLITQAGTAGAVEKLVNTEGTDTEPVVVRPGSAGVWLSGEKHVLFYPDIGEEPFRLVGNALVFETPDAVTVRIEAEVSLAEALRIARSLR